MGFGNFGAGEILIVLVIALVVFGPKRLPELGKGLGRGMRDFKDAVSGNDQEQREAEEAEARAKQALQQPAPQPVAAQPVVSEPVVSEPVAAPPSAEPTVAPPTPPTVEH